MHRRRVINETYSSGIITLLHYHVTSASPLRPIKP
uniref:Uncharacterized protein n=1 Tax=Anguilla anguilla TaxID=7936 RepID=A0A0E9PPA7_ANGAN